MKSQAEIQSSDSSKNKYLKQPKFHLQLQKSEEKKIERDDKVLKNVQKLQKV